MTDTTTPEPNPEPTPTPQVGKLEHLKTEFLVFLAEGEKKAEEILAWIESKL